MSDQTESNQPKLTIADPVDAETLKKFQQLQSSRLQVAEHLLNIEQDKIRLMRAASNIEAERQRLFEEVLMSRGLPPNYPVEIDGKTGVMKDQQAVAQAQLAANQAQAAAETPSN